ncbi:hypothetical protein [Encephalitozoon cuniculi GB-M1]|uniref:Uncharacterized protein n=2 Tax=Encephalitozoon cuniculi TaxID=6035 RepID=Q8SUK6_ENCCU|nr:uncharacterized protein ECU08_1680 [Encephalitozoon cuniculi GB-M1]AGE95139.1 hypothetical protein ECU08_1680 [Encephalitozoon cuniculi]KMV65695.1 hypothetical protein M970_081700 [Encephalitozoon cuniculi EcunIII-L]UYI27101.1 hypothetical protein J0A71_04g09510 [Encephalitozoon cuniculi]CAD26472.1 hypothetical protein [Encephalitozoon cuniculi GB-M1]
MSAGREEHTPVNGMMLSRFKQFLGTSIYDGHTRHRICKSLERSQMSLYTILTAKNLFDRMKKHLPGYIKRMEQKALSDVDRFMCGKRKKELEKVLSNEYLLFIGCTIISSKIYMDLSYTNFSWIEICHHGVDQINAAERQILQVLEYNVGLQWIELKKMYDEFGMMPSEALTNQVEVKQRKGFFKWAFGSLFRFISCVDT